MALALRRAVWISVPWIVCCLAAAAGIWAIVNGVEANARGDYAGLHYGDAQTVVRNVLIAHYGKAFAAGMHYGKPNVLNTHFNDPVRGTGQVRVFNIIGPRGVKYCISVWSGNGSHIGSVYIADSYLLQKGC